MAPPGGGSAAVEQTGGSPWADRAAIADAVVARMRACTSVAGLHPGEQGNAAVHLPGRSVSGVRLIGRALAVHVVMRWGTTTKTVSDQVHAALEGIAGVDEVEVCIEDVETPPSASSGAASGAVPGVVGGMSPAEA